MYNYYEVVNAINSQTTYLQEYMFPLLIVLASLNFSLFAISLLRWFKK